jgi:hypothetical protein
LTLLSLQKEARKEEEEVVAVVVVVINSSIRMFADSKERMTGKH